MTLVENRVEEYTPRVDEDPWMDTMYTCRAIVRVTFPAVPGPYQADVSSNVADAPQPDEEPSASSRAGTDIFSSGQRIVSSMIEQLPAAAAMHAPGGSHPDIH